MEAYVPAIIWVIGAIICSFIARSRNVKPTFPRNVVVLFLGPLAIPLVFLAKPEED